MLDQGSLKLRPVLVLTGCTGRFGTVFCQRYAHAYSLIGVARRLPEAPVHGVHYLQADVEQDARGLVAKALGLHNRIDGWVNAAVYSNWQRMPELGVEEMAMHMAVNVTAPYALAKALLEQSWMAAGFEANDKQNRNILNISSIAGHKLFAGKGRGAYSSSKAALNMLSRQMAYDFRGHGVRVNALAPNSFPGWLTTEAVCDAAHALLQGRENGLVRILDKDLQYDEK